MRIELEIKALLYIQQQIIKKEIVLVSSVILDFENNDNPYRIGGLVIKEFLRIIKGKEYVRNVKGYVDVNEDVIRIAKEISATGIRAKDAAHIACAIYADCDYFVSTDDMVLKYKHPKIRFIDPTDFIMMKGN